jgi:hypothetical protein
VRHEVTFRSVAAILLVTLGGIALLSGCSGPIPLCDQASVLIGKGQLAQGMAIYARAKDQGEEGCADDGLTAAADQYGKAATEEARGAAAEQAGDISGGYHRLLVRLSPKFLDLRGSEQL